MIFNALQKIIRSGRRAAVLLPSRRVNYFFTKLMTGNKSDALLLTTFVLMLGAATSLLLQWRGLRLALAELRRNSRNQHEGLGEREIVGDRHVNLRHMFIRDEAS
jgi:hypothetical protein